MDISGADADAGNDYIGKAVLRQARVWRDRILLHTKPNTFNSLTYLAKKCQSTSIFESSV